MNVLALVIVVQITNARIVIVKTVHVQDVVVAKNK